jgi:hypothetical protein
MTRVTLDDGVVEVSIVQPLEESALVSQRSWLVRLHMLPGPVGVLSQRRCNTRADLVTTTW